MIRMNRVLADNQSPMPVCVLGAMILCLATTFGYADPPVKPNVLFMIADDLNTALSGFGHAQCKTPNLDRLAGRGVKFENMHCQ